MQVDTGVFEDLAERVAQLERQMAQVAQAEQIIRRAAWPEIRIRQMSLPKRDRHGLRLIRGNAGR